MPSQKPGWAFNQTQAHVHPNIDSERPVLALGLEGSANKLGAGVIKHAPDSSSIVLSNVRHTYITPPGEGFQPRDTALHHREWAFKVIKESLSSANVSISDLDCICYTKGERILSENRWCKPLNSRRSWHGSTLAICCPHSQNSFTVA